LRKHHKELFCLFLPNSVSANPGLHLIFFVKFSNIQNLKSGRIVIDTGKADFVSAEVVGLFSGGQIFGTPIIDGLQTIEIGIAEGTASGTGELLRITFKTNSSTDISLTKRRCLEIIQCLSTRKSPISCLTLRQL
jgi:hypothetical protein